ncbi:MAG: hypothetical protein ACREDL_12715 [Bradyrhizobium sp.]
MNMMTRTDPEQLERIASRMTAAAERLREVALAKQPHSPDSLGESETKRGGPMDIELKIEKLRADAAECIVRS